MFKYFYIFVHTIVVMTSEEELQNRTLVVALMKAGISIEMSMNKFLKPFGISLPQFNVLRILRGRKGKPANLSSINAEMIHQTSNTTRLIDRLVEKKLTERTICENNRRKIEVVLTPLGENILREIDHVLNQKEAELVSGIEKHEKSKLLQIILKII